MLMHCRLRYHDWPATDYTFTDELKFNKNKCTSLVIMATGEHS